MKKLLAVLFLHLLFAGLQAQNTPNIVISSVTLTDSMGAPLNQIALNQAFNYQVTYFQSGNPGVTFSNYIDLVINPLTTGLIDTLLADSIHTFTPPSDTVVINYADNATAARYGGGGGGVVVIVWPIYRDLPQTPPFRKDSVQTNLIASILSPIDWNPNIIFFPNPVNSNLFLAYLDKNLKIEHVRLSNIWGQEIWSMKGQPESISTENLVNGLYLLEFWDNKNRHIAYKIRKQ